MRCFFLGHTWDKRFKGWVAYNRVKQYSFTCRHCKEQKWTLETPSETYEFIETHGRWTDWEFK